MKPIKSRFAALLLQGKVQRTKRLELNPWSHGPIFHPSSKLKTAFKDCNCGFVYYKPGNSCFTTTVIRHPVTLEKNTALVVEVLKTVAKQPAPQEMTQRSWWLVTRCRLIFIDLWNVDPILFIHSFIHSFITEIYITPLQGYYSEAPPTLARLKGRVLRLEWNASERILGSNVCDKDCNWVYHCMLLLQYKALTSLVEITADSSNLPHSNKFLSL